MQYCLIILLNIGTTFSVEMVCVITKVTQHLAMFDILTKTPKPFRLNWTYIVLTGIQILNKKNRQRQYFHRSIIISDPKRSSKNSENVVNVSCFHLGIRNHSDYVFFAFVYSFVTSVTEWNYSWYVSHLYLINCIYNPITCYVFNNTFRSEVNKLLYVIDIVLF